MADVMIAVMPFHGHVAPLVAVAEAFLAAGHRVRVYTGAAHADRFTAIGARVVTWASAPDFDEHDLPATFPALRGKKGPRQMLTNVEQLFVRTGAGQATDLTRAYAEQPWDVIVADGLSIGAHFASELTATPWVTVSIVPLTIPSRDLPPPILGLQPAKGLAGRLRDRALRGMTRMVSSGIQRAYAEERTRAGLPLDDLALEQAFMSPQLVCASGVAELEYPRSDLATQVVFVGELTRPRANDAALPSWWPDVESCRDPILHVTQGTLNVDPHDLIEPSFTALGRQRVLLIASTGRSDVAELPFTAPPNARVAGFIPYDSLLPRLDVMITNGGWGGVLAALAQGIPLIVAGGDLDKPEIAARVAWAGAGVNLRTGRPRPRAILDAWRRVTSDGSYRANAQRLAKSLSAHDGPREVVDHTMALLARA
ncbi:UDP:flavonoid glycosyltransferase YjiC, YdhE family [Agromyces cerinus subsp. cerinus]|uniref:UDP:flavonoid glycosyltransferase YjiC, YdhE family n=2 Tax=Agromyces cerinus TaxID=33878 RepID=A0A1N6DTB7_9MICO|nr:UDP:flavonoid glycosyltransferase YjiC, YdhE family [Agromyces cerinus subsp. cerinus]